MNRIRRLLDRLRHPGEGQTQRAFRRWRDTTGRGEPYRIPATVREGGPWPQMATRQHQPGDLVLAALREGLADGTVRPLPGEGLYITEAGRRAMAGLAAERGERGYGPIVGARIVNISSRRSDDQKG